VTGPQALGYTVGGTEIGSVQAVVVDQKAGRQCAAADARREGTAIGLPR
jgi:gamma-glutamyltranspeptidase